MTPNWKPGPLPGCAIPSATEAPAGPPAPVVRDPARRGAAAGRFGVLNAFVDRTLRSLTRNELAVWLVL